MTEVPLGIDQTNQGSQLKSDAAPRHFIAWMLSANANAFASVVSAWFTAACFEEASLVDDRLASQHEVDL